MATLSLLLHFYFKKYSENIYQKKVIEEEITVLFSLLQLFKTFDHASNTS